MPWSKERHAEDRTVELTCELIGRGHADRLLLSQDVCRRSHLKAYGGNGYDYILTVFLDRLRSAGVDDETLHLVTVENPRRLLEGA